MRETIFLRAARTFSLLGAVCLLASCGPRYAARYGTELKPEDDAGLVIIGQTVRTEWILCNFTSYWYPMGSPTGTEAPSDFFWARETSCENGAPRARYNIFRLAPGDYYLAYVQSKTPGEQTSMYINKKLKSGFDRIKTPKFTLAKGEVLYIGDIVFDKIYPAKAIAVRRNDDRALAALKEQVGTELPMTFRSALP